MLPSGRGNVYKGYFDWSNPGFGSRQKETRLFQRSNGLELSKNETLRAGGSTGLAVMEED